MKLFPRILDGRAMLVVLAVVLCLQCGPVWGQQQINPLSYAEVETALEGGVREQPFRIAIEGRRLDFEVTDAVREELKAKGASDALLDFMKKHQLPATLRIQCEPVDCEVLIDGNPAGATESNTLLFRNMSPGDVSIEVRAEGYRPIKLDNVRLEVGKLAVLPVFRLQSALGSLVLLCGITEAECEVSLDGPAKVQQKGRRIELDGLAPGDYRVTVAAAGFSSADQTIRVTSGPMDPVTLSPLMPLPGTIIVHCDASGLECEISMDGAPTTRRGNRVVFDNVAPTAHRINAGAPGFSDVERLITVDRGVTENVEIHLAPDPDVIFGKILAALGGESSLQQARVLQATAECTSASDGPPRTGKCIESVMLPQIRWDMIRPEQSDRKWSVGAVVDKGVLTYWSNGDSQIKNTTLASDLARSFRAYEKLRLSELIPSLNNSRYRKQMVTEGDTLYLEIASVDETFRISYDEKFLPRTLIHDPRSGVLKTEISYLRYGPVSGMTLPFEITIKFPDRPSFFQQIKYEEYLFDTDLRENDFRKDSFLKEVYWKKKDVPPRTYRY